MSVVFTDWECFITHQSLHHLHHHSVNGDCIRLLTTEASPHKKTKTHLVPLIRLVKEDQLFSAGMTFRGGRRSIVAIHPGALPPLCSLDLSLRARIHPSAHPLRQPPFNSSSSQLCRDDGGISLYIRFSSFMILHKLIQLDNQREKLTHVS